MINFKKVSFVKSSPSLIDRPEKHFPELLFVGRSNVGKSSLINALVSSNIAYTSKKPGHTKLLNYFLVDNKFYLVDAPGYGFARGGSLSSLNFGKMMEDYFTNEDLKCVIFILDSRIKPTKDDISFYNYLLSNDINYIMVLSKCDKLNQKEKAQIKKNVFDALVNVNFENVVYSSIKDNNSLDEIRARISKVLL